MPDKDINIHVRAQDTAETKRQVEDVSKSVEQLGQKTAESSGQAADKMSLWASILGKAGNYLLGIFGAAALIRETTAAIREQNEALKEHAQIALEQQNQLLRLQFLGDYYKEKPELRKQVMAYAEAGRRPFEDVANAMYDLRNLGGGLTAGQQEEILTRSMELGRTMPQVPLTKIMQAMFFYSKQTKNKDIGQVQNIIKEILSRAGGQPEEAAADMTRFIPLGLTAGMTAEEAAGTWAFATSQFPEAGRATAGLTLIIQSLLGQGTDRSKRMLRRLGITPKMSFLEQIKQLSAQQAAGKIGMKELTEITSPREAPILLALMQNAEGMMKTIESITAAAESKEDLTAKSIEGLYGQDEMARFEDLSRFLGISIKNLKAMDMKAVKLETGKKIHEMLLRKQGVSELAIRIEKMMDALFAGLFGKTMGRWENYPESEIKNIQNFEPNLPAEPGEMPAEPNQPVEPNSVIINNNQVYDSSMNIYPTVGEIEPNRMTFNE